LARREILGAIIRGTLFSTAAVKDISLPPMESQRSNDDDDDVVGGVFLFLFAKEADAELRIIFALSLTISSGV